MVTAVNIILEFNQSIEEHGSAFFREGVVVNILGAATGVIRVSVIDVEGLHCLWSNSAV